MTTLIVPTDFSPNAEKSLDQALLIASRTGSSLDLLHTVELEHVESTYFHMRALEEAKNAESRMDRLVRTRIEALGISQDITWKVHVQYVDTLEESILELFEQTGARLVVMGTKGINNWVDKLFGSHTGKLIGKATVPVLCIPPEWTPVPLQHLAVCIEPGQVVHHESEIQEWGKWMGCSVEWLHFTILPSAETPQTDTDVPYQEVLSPAETPLYRDIVEYSRRLHATAIVMFVRQRSLFRKLIDPSITRKTAGLIEVPLLAIPAKD